ncbi:MAG: HEAT repeat domain-containing protein [Myxococcota bacterium]
MGIFDLFARKGPGAVRKHSARAANRRAQNPDRWESIQWLAEQGTEETVTALLQRFTIRVTPSIIDQEEKDAAFQGIVAAGDVAVAPIKHFIKSADSISWPLKALEQLLPADEVVGVLLELLADLDTEYERDPEKKIQVVAYVEDRQDPRILEAVLRFLDDMDETVRFHAVGATLAQDNCGEGREALMTALLREESVRVRARILDGFNHEEWPIGDEHREEVRKALPDRYALDPAGLVRKKD